MRAFFIVAAIMLSAASALPAAEGAYRQLGRPGAWANTRAGAVLDGQLYTAEASGSFYATDLSSGVYRQIGKAMFADTQFLFASGGSLYSIEKSGSFYRISPADGSYERLGQPGDWANTLAGTILDGKLYTAEASGALYATDLSSGTYQQIGGADFGGTAFLFASGGSLYSIEKSGNLYRINPADGAYERLGQAGDWSGTLAGAVIGTTLYSAESSGALYATDLSSGTWRKLGEPTFGNTAFMFASADGVFTFEKDGSLYAVDTGSAPSYVSSPAVPASPASLPPSETSAAAVAGNLTFAFMGTWKGDASTYEKDAAYQEAAKANPQMAQGLLSMIGSASMKVTLDGITMEVMGEKAAPVAFTVITSEGNDLVIENQDGPKKGVQSTVTFIDASHIKVVEGANAAQAMYFVKQ
jgi:sugar lactone lactonase YvrE